MVKKAAVTCLHVEYISLSLWHIKAATDPLLFLSLRDEVEFCYPSDLVHPKNVAEMMFWDI